MLKNLGSITIFVNDQAQALDFYTEKIGLEVRRDDNFGPIRWIEVGVPGSLTSIVLFPRRNPLYQEDLMREFTGIQFVTEDIQATYEELSSRGVPFSQPPTPLPFGTTAVFTDEDKNQFSLLQVGP